MDRHIIHDFVVKEVWRPVKIRWWKPSTWGGGYWVRYTKDGE
ncbi:MAG: hypothetical protein WC450_12540 [Candidatus Omnitrophota bacterium]